MITLNQMLAAVSTYLSQHGDKEIESIGTYNGTAPIGFELHLCDIYNGPIGYNPFTGKDSIQLYKNGDVRYDKDRMLESEGTENHKKIIDGVTDFINDLSIDNSKTLEFKQEILWNSLELLCRLSLINKNEMKTLWCEFSVTQFEQKHK